MKELYIMQLKEAELIPEAYCLSHFPVRMERALKYKFREDRLRCIGAGALLCGAAGIRENELIYNDYGKPLHEGKHFSISHSGSYIILAVSDSPVGADVEDTSRKYADIARRVCTQEELIWLHAYPTETGTMGETVDEEVKRFYLLWTLKESIMKAEGLGLSMHPQSFSVLPMTEGKSIRICDREYFSESFELDGHMISVCGADEPVNQIHITEEML